MSRPTPSSGPVISEASLERILSALDGARVLTGGERLDRPGWWLAPTVLEDVAADAELGAGDQRGEPRADPQRARRGARPHRGRAPRPARLVARADGARGCRGRRRARGR